MNTHISSSVFAAPRGLVASWFGRLHRNERGNLGVLMLFVIWALLAMIAMVWNTGEYATRKAAMQTAVDASAHAAVTHPTRALNILSATNLLICENASAEIFYRSVVDTKNGIQNRLNNEERNATNRIRTLDQQEARRALTIYEIKERQCLYLVLQSIPIQRSYLQQFVERTAPAFFTTQVTDFAPRREEMFGYQKTIVDMTPMIVEDQRAAMMDFYKTDLVHAKPRQTTTLEESQPVYVPVKLQANTNDEGVYHGGVPVAAPATSVQGDAPMNVTVNGGQWGEIYCAPLFRYLNERVGIDYNRGRWDSLAMLLSGLDAEREVLRTLMWQICQPPTDPPPTPQEIIEWNNLWDRVEHYGDGMAVATWRHNLWRNRRAMLYAFGQREVMTLQTYGYYPIPDWAQPQMYTEAWNYVYRRVWDGNYDRLWRMKRGQLRRLGLTTAVAEPIAQAWARPIVHEGATIIANETAPVWVAREWPYEVQPPQTATSRGRMTDEDRLVLLTVVVGARSTDATNPKLWMSKWSGIDATKPLVTSAQAETFNWMEYHGNGGGFGRWNGLTFPNTAFNDGEPYTGPPPWRISTIPGWNWQPRLAYQDGLADALKNNPMLRRWYEEAGVLGTDNAAIKSVVQH